jgi:diguanylate cyclase (GGDEF)-like protein
MVFDSSQAKLLTDLANDLSHGLNVITTKDRVTYLAYHEPLTGLGNRVMLQERLLYSIKNAQATNSSFILVIININNFRQINETLGHKNGDILLNKMACRLRTAVQSADLVACTGGDEFAMIIPQRNDDIDYVVTALTSALDKNFQLADLPLHIEVRMGVAIYPRDGDTLWMKADIALSEAAKNQKVVCYYKAEYDRFEPQSVTLLSEFRDAIENDELILYWQPKLNIQNHKIIGAEALVRWQHPTRGLLFPDSFIPFVERTGLIKDLTKWVIENALNQGGIWIQACVSWE